MRAKPPPSMNIEGAVFNAALALQDTAEREDFLKHVFHGDNAGLARMRGLLEKAGESSAFFMEVREHRGTLAGEILREISAESREDGEELPPPVEGPGSHIGPYRLIARIGEGGCGVIYEAEQQKPVHRRVALKIIRLGMDTESVIARFEVERQALALMDHPNIARVFDAGATAAGRPYFVMERVSGERITACCDREKLGITARIRLFIQVCHAIQHAHQKGIIHRDIKPSNVLVAFHDGVPVPKVIDFGIAKAAGRSGQHRTPWTGQDQLMGTPPYMSPEQVDMSGLDVDTRSDIYSLGALLHELLTGRAPFDGDALAAAGISEMRRTLLEREPPPMSRMLADLPAGEREPIAALRGEEPARLVSRLRGDLDWIVAKAMAKDRSRRYQTVNNLAAELRRFLHNEPVRARPPGRLYLLDKFVRRNRAACISAAAIALSLAGGFGVSTRLYLLEREARAEQARLGHEAKAARAEEFRLRAQAQARANISQVAVLLSEDRIEEADALLRENPLETIEPSLEAAWVFRSLGNWNAIHGRWAQAVQCYVLLNQANRLDDPVNVVEDTDLLATAPALLEYGDRRGYEAFRRDALDRYLPARNSLAAEHLLKICLLTPADAAFMERLRDAAEVCARGIPTESGRAIYPHWEALSTTLYHHRLGKVEETLEWGEKCLAYPDDTGSRAAAALCLTAMARHRAGHADEASKDLDEARRLIAAASQAAREHHERGSWFSWVIARILLREAELEVEKALR